MIRKLLVLTLLITLGCSSDDTKIKEPEGDGSYMEFFSDGIDRKVTWGNFKAKEECHSIFISGGSLDPENKYHFSFELTDTGHIVRMHYYELTDIYHYYSCADYQPAETFTISNFSYDKASGEFYFEFEGLLYEEKHYPTPDEFKTKHLSGKMYYKNTLSDECSFFPPRAFMNDEGIYFTEWRKTSSILGVENIYDSTNGYSLRIWSHQDLTEFAPGTYDFAPESNLHIKLYKYIGPLQNYINESWDWDNWIEYTCEGRITINGHYGEPYDHTTGTFVFSAFDDNGNTVLEFAEGSFETF